MDKSVWNLSQHVLAAELKARKYFRWVVTKLKMSHCFHVKILSDSAVSFVITVADGGKCLGNQYEFVFGDVEVV